MASLPTASRPLAVMLLCGIIVSASCLQHHELNRKNLSTRRGAFSAFNNPFRNNHHVNDFSLAKRRHQGQLFMSNTAAETSSSEAADSCDTLELVESILIDEVVKSVEQSFHPDKPTQINNSLNNNAVNDSSSRSGTNNQALSALQRAVEIGNILTSQVVAPILFTLANNPPDSSLGWESFWSSSTADNITNAQRLSYALEMMGPTYVKFGQALGSRPDVVPPSLARALSTLQDDMKPFDGETAKDIVWRELHGRDITMGDLESLMANLTQPVAAASIGQVYRAHLSGVGDVAVKVQRPGVRRLVERDTELLLTVATFLESLPALSISNKPNIDSNKSKQSRLINTQLVSATQEFMSRVFEELDYRNEAKNCLEFANLYSRNGGNSTDVSVVVPKVYMNWCTENVLVMEWIEGTKLTDVQTNANTKYNANNLQGNDSVKENLALVKVAIDSTLSQLLVTGVLHADPHAGNLLKVRLEDGSITLGYLDFGLLSTIPSQVRDALVCSVVLQVFSRDIDAVSSLFGELQLIPQHVLADAEERRALAEALEITFENSLLYPKSSNAKDDTTQIPELKFDKLLDSLSRLVPRFQFDLPPYFINNARALSTLEGIAKSLDPTFNVLTIMYPYALNMLLRNPSGSPVVASTLQSLIRSSDGRIDREKIRQLLRDSALISGRSKRRVVWDILKAREGRKLAREILSEELQTVQGRGISNYRSQPRKRKRRWFYLDLS